MSYEGQTIGHVVHPLEARSPEQFPDGGRAA
jgi:putative hydrolase of the HAD superfamily